MGPRVFSTLIAGSKNNAQREDDQRCRTAWVGQGYPERVQYDTSIYHILLGQFT